MSILIVWVAIAAIAWCMWVRRITWYCRWERAITLAGAFFGAGLLLVQPPIAKPINDVLLAATRQPQLSTFIGHTLIVCGAAAFVYAILSRFAFHDTLQAKFGRSVSAPMIIAGSIRLLLFTTLDAGDTIRRHDTYPIMEKLYWLLLAGSVMYLLGFAVRALLILRQSAGHRPIADLYLLSCSAGMGLCCVVMVGVLIPPVGRVARQTYIAQALTLFFMGGFAFAATYSWRKKTRPIKRIRATV